MITLFTLTPDRLNLNGDQGNLLVLSKRAAWRGVDSKVVQICAPNDMADALLHVATEPRRSFLLIGHGTFAAMATLAPFAREIRDFVAQMLALEVPVLAVASGFELIRGEVSRKERESEFRVASSDGHKYLGYLNSDADLPVFERVGLFYGTLLHGPILVKNPELADEILALLGVQLGINDRLREIDDLVAMVWELEA